MKQDACCRRSIWLSSIIAVLVMLAPRDADARKVVVMRAEGKVDSFTRKQLEYELLELARHVDPKATQVDFLFADAAAVSNCIGDLEKCRGPVLDEFGVDEILVGTVESAADGNLQVTVRRATKGKPIQTVTFRTRAETLGNEVKGNAGAWYGVTSTTPPIGSPPATRPSAQISERAEVGEAEPPPALPSRPSPSPAPIAGSPTPQDEYRPRAVGRGYLGGVIGGGALVAVGVVLWTRASSTQGDIDSAAVGTEVDLRHLQDLEDTGHSYAVWGNVSVIAGVALAATCGYLYWRAQHGASHSVAIAPAVGAHGVGVTLMIGGL